MKNLEWKQLQAAAISFASALTLAISGTLWSIQFEKDQKRTLRKEQRRLREVQRQHSTASEDISQVHIFYPRFQALEKRGIIGMENRIAWVESLTTVGRRLNLSELTYDVGPPTPFQVGFPVPAGGGELFASAMGLSMKLLHEEDVLRLFEGLAENTQELFTVQQCSISRLTEKISPNSASPNLSCSCRLLWLHVRDRDGQWGHEEIVQKKGSS